MKALVCGGRNFSDYNLLKDVLDGFEDFKGEKITEVIHGKARGADRLADRWAKETGIDVHSFPADWGRYGNAAGPIRNQQMLDDGKPDVVIAFPGGTGTADMIKKARRAKVRVVIF